MPFQAAIVDLDGTMVDTLGDFVVVLQHTLTDVGCHPVELARVDRAFIELTVGKGTEDLVRRSLAHAWGLSPDDADVTVALPQALRAAHITGSDRLRIEAMERMADAASTGK